MSDKTIAEKMYLKTVKSLAVFNGAAHPGMVAQLPQELITGYPGERDTDAVLLFALNQTQLEEFFPQALACLNDMGTLWIAYLKPTAPKATDLTRESINTWTKERGVTGVALISLDMDWSAVRLKRM
jgi:hypothetical protein